MRSIIFAILFIVFSLPTAALDGHTKGPQSPKEVQEAFLDAILKGDIKALSGLYHESAISFPIFNAQRVTGPDGVMGDWGPFLQAFKVNEIELFNTGEITRGDVGAAWGQFRMTFRPKAGGDATTVVGRYMDVSQKIGERWYYIADHASFPTPSE